MSDAPPDAIAPTVTTLRAGRTSAASVIGAALERIDAASSLNAFASVDPFALEIAEAIDAARGGGERAGPLVGVPIAVKDLIDHAGRPNSLGTSGAPETPTVTAPVIARLERAGAVVVGRTGLHEYAFGFSSENHWFGPVRNPWDLELSVGGSSGGSGAAVASGVVPAALGTDTGGSVRVPAALCGVVGLKVTHGRVPTLGVYPLAPSLDTVGPLARTVADAAAVYAVMAGDEPTDPWSAPRPVTLPAGPAEPDRLTVAVPHPWVDGDLHRDVAAAFTTSLERMREAGVRVIDVDAPLLTPPGRIAASVNFEVAAVHRDRFGRDPGSYGPDVAERMTVAMGTTSAEYLDALTWRAATRHAAERIFSQCDLIATPTVATTRKPIGRDMVDLASGSAHYRSALSRFTALVNHIGLPALALPLAGPGIPPPSLQLIAPAWHEADLLAAGHLMEMLGVAVVQRPPHWFG